ncbi:hypothetical protein [Lacticaseibacillus pantheris]|uniref:hypothetical protein n=1 Tax=Lacticaseibacillus pantheris TaxID=171523 RepID=UPI0006D24643|nr:hypothetical protein [Lacticaseibacillus pantheris]
MIPVWVGVSLMRMMAKLFFLPYHAIDGTDIDRFLLDEDERIEFDAEEGEFGFDGITGQYRATRVRPLE